MPEAIVIRSYGASDVLTLEDIDVPAPAAGELRLRQTAIGVNFHDIYVRSGLYNTLTPPGILGCEATGIVDAVGADVDAFQIGDRVGYVTGPPYGAYATHRLLPAKAAVPLPETISDDLAAATLLRALTVDMLTQRCTDLSPGMTILVHAAAGGVGRLLCQMASHLGATVLGTVGSAEKSEIAKASGCSHPILYREKPFQEEVLRLTDGRGVDVVYDSIGADTFDGSLASLTTCGHLVNFGQSSGAVPPLMMSTLAEKSLTVTRPILFHYLQDTAQYRAMAKSVFEAFSTGIFCAGNPDMFALRDTAQAHDMLERRTATRGIVLKP
ncbi:quinone oxidoreductase family protein [Pelagimonas varians]|uniref:Quinone oxidoreductase 1 n=1 Tax=Pelagimonas varians TaxID=696760 RepID=A0A238L4U5_9RHOB|nr:quinone oxidoreductase [Pelagimonas varians]PYG25464.1 NADPH:quinone reductase-like Zn-dependent oxidoreductase [Pelagimonas varians]SMX49851.1 Quinone oxidoreductase 1 [Pelagimonas varians]